MASAPNAGGLGEEEVSSKSTAHPPHPRRIPHYIGEATADDYAGRFYCAAATDLDADVVYEVVKPKFCECAPDCLPDASARTYRWDGADFVER
ncbi:MAG TPA: hypothetical protein VJS45_07190 [Acidimicrobiia bacterium]|nr:hypothetical protein [Acidimicrobiia bacterium]